MSENIKKISEFCESWPHLTREDFVALFTEDAVYRNIPFPGDVIGGQGVADVLVPIAAKLAGIEATVLNAGEVILTSTAEAVRADPTVRQIYLGE